MSEKFDVAILVIIYDRPEYLKKLLFQISAINASKIYVFCDAPHDSSAIPGINACKHLIQGINYAEVHTYYLDSNIGPGRGISSAISWFFEHEEEGIIFESDCIPSLSFFPFCKILLEKYRRDSRISVICGNNFAEWNSRDDYFFSTNLLIWGFATWRRTWKNYDLEMCDWGLSSKSHCISYFSIPMVGRIQYNRINHFYESEIQSGRCSSWDFQLLAANIKNDALTIIPKWNLVSNIGSEGGVNHKREWFYHNRPAKSSFVVEHHPGLIKQNKILDFGIFISFFFPDWLASKYYAFRNPIIRMLKRII